VPVTLPLPGAAAVVVVVAAAAAVVVRSIVDIAPGCTVAADTVVGRTVAVTAGRTAGHTAAGRSAAVVRSIVAAGLHITNADIDTKPLLFTMRTHVQRT